LNVHDPSNIKQLEIYSPFPIYRIGTRVFQINEINPVNIDREEIIKLLDMGLKFVPHNNFNISDLYYNIL
jgi:hypothetical protein